MEKYYGTPSETIRGLKKEGYTLDFNIKEQCVICPKSKTALSPEDFEIDRVYRFEGATNPEDQSILYAISSTKADLKRVSIFGNFTLLNVNGAKRKRNIGKLKTSSCCVGL